MALLKTEGVEIDFASDAIARIAVHVNPTIENIGVRRFQTVMEQVLDEVNFLAPDRTGERITIDGVFVETNVGDLAKNTDFSRFIL